MVIVCCQDQISFVINFEYIPQDVPYHRMYFGRIFLKLGLFHMSSISRECVRPPVIVFATRQWDWESHSSRQERVIFSPIYILDGVCFPSENLWSPQLVHLMFRTKFWQDSSWSGVQVVLCKTFHRWQDKDLLQLDCISVSTGVSCPSIQVEEWKFPQTARHNITGKYCC